MLLTIYDKAGTKRADVAVNDSSTQSKEVQGDNVLALSFSYYAFLELDVNDYTDYLGERYWLMERYKPVQKSEGEWEYDIKMYGVESLVKRFLVLDLTDGKNEAVFTLTAPPREHVDLVVRSINAGMHTSDWKAGSVEGDEYITIEYHGKYCHEALKEIAEKTGGKAEWWVEGQTVNICRCEQGEPVVLGYGKGLTELNCDLADNVGFYTRLYPLGSRRNIDPEKYGHTRLQLPGEMSYVDVNVEEYGVWDRFEESAFAEIYPRYTGTVSSVRSEEKKDEKGKLFRIYYFKDNNLPFDPNQYELAGEKKRVSFQSGDMAGLGQGDEHFFEVNYDSKSKEFELITIWPYEDGTQLPGGKLIPKAGDLYIPWNIRMPEEYYPLAEQEFKKAVDAYNDEHTQDVRRFKAPTDSVFLEDAGVVLRLGSRVRLESAHYFPKTGYKLSRVTKIVRKVNLPSALDIEISDVISAGTMESLNGHIDDAQEEIRQLSSALPDLIKTGDGTLPTDNNVLSALRSLMTFLRKDREDATDFLLRLLGGVEIGRFESGVSGANVDKDGNAELNKAKLRGGLNVGSTEEGKPAADIDKDGNTELNALTLRGLLTALHDVLANHIQVGEGLKHTDIDPESVTTAHAKATEVTTEVIHNDGDNAVLHGNRADFKGNVGSRSFASGMTGVGWNINNSGDAEMKGLRLREFLEVPELRYNRVSVISGEQWSAPGGGIIEEVDTAGGRLKLKLEAGEAAALEVDDICKGIYHHENGFSTCFFRITETVGDGWFRYTLRPGYEMHPTRAMHFVAYGNFTNKERQKSAYISKDSTRYLHDVNDWEITERNIAMMLGNLSGMRLDGKEMKGYSAMLRNIYLTGTIKQLSGDGVTETLIPAWKGEWKQGVYYKNDEVTHNGATWLCVAEKTEVEPALTSPDWLQTVSEGKDTITVSVFSTNGQFFKDGKTETDLYVVVMQGDKDITSTLGKERFNWIRTSANSEADVAWSKAHEGAGSRIHITDEDVEGRANFDCVVKL